MKIESELEKTNIEKTFFAETRRICAPEKTVEKIKKIFPVIGITRLANITGLDRIGIPVYAAYRPNARSISTAQGKGYTHAAAQASAIMESVETYHAEHIENELKFCSLNELSCKHTCIDTSLLPQRHGSDFHADKRILWIEGIDLFTHKKTWIPYETVHTDYRAPLPSCHGSFVSSSNGLSSGNSIHEALIHGICEVIERDSLSAWEILPDPEKDKRKICLQTITDERAASLIQQFSDAGIAVGVWDITGKAGIPTFLCRIIPQGNADVAMTRPASGMGCHLSREIALLRALTEAAQSRITFISGTRDDLTKQDYIKYVSDAQYEAWQDDVSLKGKKDFLSVPNKEEKTLDKDLHILLEELRKINIREVIAVNLTKEEFGIPVVRTIIPGMAFFSSISHSNERPVISRPLFLGKSHVY